MLHKMQYTEYMYIPKKENNAHICTDDWNIIYNWKFLPFIVISLEMVLTGR